MRPTLEPHRIPTTIAAPSSSSSPSAKQSRAEQKQSAEICSEVDGEVSSKKRGSGRRPQRDMWTPSRGSASGRRATGHRRIADYLADDRTEASTENGSFNTAYSDELFAPTSSSAGGDGVGGMLPAFLADQSDLVEVMLELDEESMVVRSVTPTTGALYGPTSLAGGGAAHTPPGSGRSLSRRALKGLRFISRTTGSAEAAELWTRVEHRFNALSRDGLLSRDDFGDCIGMEDSKEFAVGIFDALARRRRQELERISKEELYDFWLIVLSASANKLSKLKEQAEEYALLIMEELDPEDLGYIELWQLEALLLQRDAYMNYSRPLSSGSTAQWSQNLGGGGGQQGGQGQGQGQSEGRRNDWRRRWSPRRAAARAQVAAEENWRRAWVLALWFAAMAGLFAWKFVQYRRTPAFRVMGYCLPTAKGAAETLKLNMALVLLPVCRNTLTWLRSSWARFFVPFDDSITFHKVESSSGFKWAPPGRSNQCSVAGEPAGTEDPRPGRLRVKAPVIQKSPRPTGLPLSCGATIIATAIALGICTHAGTHLACDFPRLIGSSREEYELLLSGFFGASRPTYRGLLAGVEGVTGIVMVVLMVVSFTLATRPLRKREAPRLPFPLGHLAGFNAFWYSHHLLIVVYLLLLVHGWFMFLVTKWHQRTTWMYIAVPLMLYVGERTLRAFRSKAYAVKILKVCLLPGNVLTITMSKPYGFRYRSGQYIFLQCPTISPFEWHPFSITSAPGDDYISVHIQTRGDWTQELKRIFVENYFVPSVPRRASFGALGMAEQKSPPRLLVDGPYGAPAQDFRNYDVLLLVGLGIGATPFISILRDLLNNIKLADELMDLAMETSRSDDSANSFSVSTASSNKRRAYRTSRAHFYWVTREPGSFEWFKGVMNEVAEMDKKGVIELHNYLTSVYEERDARSTLLSMVQALNHAKHGVDIVSGTRVRTHFARPNWKEVFTRIASKHPNSTVGVFYCGKPTLAKELKKLSLDMSHKTTTRYHFHKEYF
uniref:FAD-binding FR-type domain-containing protein n=1 Tax=Oryza glumipatula TaxID=40148 RepID=A0A0E0AW71_9ORYZ